VDDTERRLNILFDGLNNETVPKQAVDKMHEIARGEFDSHIAQAKRWKLIVQLSMEKMPMLLLASMCNC
jgi:hypothetical protein